MASLPPAAIPPEVLQRIEAYAATFAPHEFSVICNTTAAEFRVLARQWYELGDETRGDKLTARALAWEAAAVSGDLADVRP